VSHSINLKPPSGAFLWAPRHATGRPLNKLMLLPREILGWSCPYRATHPRSPLALPAGKRQPQREPGLQGPIRESPVTPGLALILSQGTHHARRGRDRE